MEMTGQTNPDARALLWEKPNTRLYFMTPGTLKNDIKKGRAPVIAPCGSTLRSPASP